MPQFFRNVVNVRISGNCENEKNSIFYFSNSISTNSNFYRCKKCTEIIFLAKTNANNWKWLQWSRKFSSMKFLTTSLEIFYDLTNSKNGRECAWKKIYTIVLASKHILCWASNIFFELLFLSFYLIRHFCALTVGVVLATQNKKLKLLSQPKSKFTRIKFNHL